MNAGIRAFLVTLTLAATAAPAFAVDLRIGTPNGTQSADPHFTGVPAAYGINSAIFDPLVRLSDKEAVPEPWLAESWRLIDDTTWEFKLRRDVTFHDGSPFTARDVAFSYMRAKTLNASALPLAN